MPRSYLPPSHCRTHADAPWYALIDAMADGLVCLDHGGRATYANPAAERLLGRPASAIVAGGPVERQWRCVRADGTPLPGHEHPVAIARRKGIAVADVDLGLYRPDDSLVWLRVSAAPLGGQAGAAGGVVVTLVDVTRHKVLEQGLQASDAEHRGYFDSRTVGIAVADCRGQWVRVNEQLCWMLGQPQAELVTQPLAHRLHPEDRERLDVRMRELARGARSSFEFDIRYVCRDGRTLWTLTAVSALAASPGHPADAMWTVLDIDARKRAEAALRESEARHRRLADDHAALVAELRASLANVKTLAALVPVCSWCHKLRSDEGFWTGLEEYLATHADSQVTHGICPDCATSLRERGKSNVSDSLG